MDEDTNRWLSLAIVAVIAGGIFYWFGPSRVWYAAEYEVSLDKVHIAPKPTDCNFWHAPVGFKDCHYEKWVAAEMAPGSKGCDDVKPDDKGWRLCPPAEGNPNVKYSSVYVSWEKKSD